MSGFADCKLWLAVRLALNSQILEYVNFWFILRLIIGGFPAGVVSVCNDVFKNSNWADLVASVDVDTIGTSSV